MKATDSAMLSTKDKLTMSYRTIVEMLEDRKVLSDDNLDYLKSFGPNELDAMLTRGTLSIEIEKQLKILYYLNKFKITDFKPHLKQCDGFELCILIVSDKLTTNHNNGINDFIATNGIKTTLQTFELAEVLFNITKHVLVPKHEVLTDKMDIDNLLKNYNLKNLHQLPIILKTDPVARYYGMKSGQVVRITRMSPSAGEYIAYRCCA